MGRGGDKAPDRNGLLAPIPEVEVRRPGLSLCPDFPVTARGQHEAAAPLQWHFLDHLMTRLTERGHCFVLTAAQLGMTFVVPPSHPLVRLESQLFGVLLLRRLRLPLPPFLAYSPMWPST